MPSQTLLKNCSTLTSNKIFMCLFVLLDTEEDVQVTETHSGVDGGMVYSATKLINIKTSLFKLVY